MPTYELQCEYTNHIRSIQTSHVCPHCWIRSAIDGIEDLFDREQDKKKAQALLGMATDDYLGTINQEDYSTSAVTPCEDWDTYRVWIAKTFPIVHTVTQACHLYTVIGMNDEAVLLLQSLASRIKRDVPKAYGTRASYDTALAKLAFCSCANTVVRAQGSLSIKRCDMCTGADNTYTVGDLSRLVGRSIVLAERLESSFSFVDFHRRIARRMQTYKKLYGYLVDKLLGQSGGGTDPEGASNL